MPIFRDRAHGRQERVVVTKASDAAEQQKFDEQLETAVELVAKPIDQMLQAREIDPYVIVVAVAKVAGELAAAFAAAGRYDREEVLGDIAEIVRRCGRNYHEALTDETPVAGNA